jgi:ubiquinone/menaquinone biosynthesis C-methylase UbiE
MPDRKNDRYEFYDAQYARFGSKLAAEVRREAYGEDLGQQGWRTLVEQNEIITLISQRPNTHFLDVACGSGGPSLALAARTGCRLTGVDIEAAGIAQADSLAEALGLSEAAKFLVADCSQRLPFNEATFDLVTCIDAILHLRDRYGALKDWFRLLRPGGRLLMTDAAVLSGAVSKLELDIRASQGEFSFVPPGINEKAIMSAGFNLQKCADTTQAIADIAFKLYAARKARSQALQDEEGAEWFAKRQLFLQTSAVLAASGRLSRFLYVAQKPE